MCLFFQISLEKHDNIHVKIFFCIKIYSLQYILLWDICFLQNIIFAILDILKKKITGTVFVSLQYLTWLYKSFWENLWSGGRECPAEFLRGLKQRFFWYISIIDHNIWMLKSLNFCGSLFIHRVCGFHVTSCTLKHSVCAWEVEFTGWKLETRKVIASSGKYELS